MINSYHEFSITTGYCEKLIKWKAENPTDKSFFCMENMTERPLVIKPKLLWLTFQNYLGVWMNWLGTCMSGFRVGTVVKPASGHRALFFPEVHLQRQAVGQSVQSGDARVNAAMRMTKQAPVPPVMAAQTGHLVRWLPRNLIELPERKNKVLEI